MNIRQAEPKDYGAIYQLVKTAFETARVSDGTEQDFVLGLRAGDTFLPQLEFVAEREGTLIGHVMMTRQRVETQDGPIEGVLVAPLCVALAHRGQKVGQALICYAMERARAEGYAAAFLVGDPGYYGRFGFRRSDKFGLQNDTALPDEVVLACELASGALAGVRGRVALI